tara:strand:+ start:1440 stop:1907 length:468 start_codon:yes stop_codon:yes gene_type:complete
MPCNKYIFVNTIIELLQVTILYYTILYYTTTTTTLKLQIFGGRGLYRPVIGAVHVPSVEFLVLLSGIVVSLVISTYAHYKITQIAASQLASRVQELDNALGEAVSNLFENGAATVQAQNPLLSLFAEALKGKIDTGNVVDVTPRSDNGTFKKLEE